MYILGIPQILEIFLKSVEKNIVEEIKKVRSQLKILENLLLKDLSGINDFQRSRDYSQAKNQLRKLNRDLKKFQENGEEFMQTLIDQMKYIDETTRVLNDSNRHVATKFKHDMIEVQNFKDACVQLYETSNAKTSNKQEAMQKRLAQSSLLVHLKDMKQEEIDEDVRSNKNQNWNAITVATLRGAILKCLHKDQKSITMSEGTMGSLIKLGEDIKASETKELDGIVCTSWSTIKSGLHNYTFYDSLLKLKQTKQKGQEGARKKGEQKVDKENEINFANENEQQQQKRRSMFGCYGFHNSFKCKKEKKKKKKKKKKKCDPAPVGAHLLTI